MNSRVETPSLSPLLTIKTESVDFVRMSCLGTSIPKAEWPIVFTEVRRILKTGGVVEVIDDELVRGYPRYPPKDHKSSTRGQQDGLHPIDRYFRQMLVERYGMPEMPHKTIDAAMELVFGINDRKHFRVELPSPNFQVFEVEEPRRNVNLLQAFRGKMDAVQSVPRDTVKVHARERINDPFLIFYPHGLCRLDASEVRMAACASMHRVMSCRASLIDFIVGPSAEGDELGEVTDMLWEYEW